MTEKLQLTSDAPPVPLTEAPARPTAPLADVEVPASLWRNRAYVTVLFGQGLSALGDAVSVTALPLLVVMLTGSGTQMGLVGVLQTVPYLLFGLPAGALADRWDRRRTMLLCDLGRGLLIALIPLSMLLGIPTMPVVYAVAAPISALAVLFMAAYTASVPSLVGRAQIGAASSYFQAFASLGFILGPGIAGLLAATIGPGPTLAVDAASFGVSALALGFVRRPFRTSERSEVGSMRAEIVEGLKYILHHNTLRAIIAFWGCISIFMAPIIPVMTYYITVDRDLPASSLGLVISAYGAGSLLGSVAAARFAKGRLGRLLLAGNVLLGGAVLINAFLVNMPMMLTGALFIGVADAIVLVAYMTLRATLTPDELLGRVSSTARVLSFGVAALGMFVGGVLLDHVGGSVTLVLMGAGVMLMTPLFTFSRALRTARAGTPS